MTWFSKNLYQAVATKWKITVKICTEESERPLSKRAFILGAGFSASAGLPLVPDLSRACLQALQVRDQQDFGLLLRTMQKFFPHTSWSRQWLPNIEDFLDRVIAYEDLFQRHIVVYPEGYFRNIRRLTSVGLCLALTIPPEDCNMTAINNFVTKTLKPGDAILTFNWDLLLESSMYANLPVERISYCPLASDEVDPSKITLIKLHGSLDWLDNNEWRPAPGSENEWEVIGHDIWKAKNSRYFASTSVGVPAFIIPPTSRKIYDQHPDIRQLWDAAFGLIRETKEIYIIGYGFPKTDIHAQALVQSAILNNTHRQEVKVRLINKDENALTLFHRDIVPSSTCDILHFQGIFEKHPLAS